MAWNEPGSGKQRDPWKDGGGSHGPSPDFDAVARRVRDFFNRLFGGGGGGIAVALFGAFIAWCAWDSMVRVNASDTGVVLRFGRFSRLMTPGINFKFPRPVETVVPVPVGKTLQTNDQVRMLTKDENIVLVDFNVQYRISDPQLFLFGVREPDATLGQAAESAVRTVIGGSDMDTILSGQRSELMVQAKQLLQANLDQYKAGLSISELNFQNVRPPQDVKDAFDDANRALQDKQRAEEEAKAYASQVVPEARGDAAAVRAEAEGYKSKVIARAEGDAQRFNLIESQYKAAPEVTRKRLYVETMEQVVGNATRVIDLTSGKNILNLPGAPDARVPAATVITPDSGKGAR
ncbi:MAG: FtsH protease activity modulator HflK [Dokdonella sp.]|uniref:FtsH protease activity modulator HflK n=1 Tax=Dokdonella sp. TaxID=2291710 RepID=UPI003F7DF696